MEKGNVITNSSYFITTDTLNIIDRSADSDLPTLEFMRNHLKLKKINNWGCV